MNWSFIKVKDSWYRILYPCQLDLAPQYSSASSSNWLSLSWINDWRSRTTRWQGPSPPRTSRSVLIGRYRGPGSHACVHHLIKAYSQSEARKCVMWAIIGEPCTSFLASVDRNKSTIQLETYDHSRIIPSRLFLNLQSTCHLHLTCSKATT